MEAKQSEFCEKFECVVPNMLRPLVSFVQNSDQVTDVWAYVTFQDGVSARSAVYRVAGEFVPLNESARLFGDPDATILAFGRSLRPLVFEMEDRSQLPNSMVVHYNLKTDEIDSNFSYEPIEFQNDESDSTHAARWAKEFRG